MIIWIWMYAPRLPAMGKADFDAATMTGCIGSTLDDVLPPKVQWKAHNYNHLLAEPTLFYAICFVIILTGTGHGLNVNIAWAYVGLRVIHSLIQTLSNRVLYRFSVFVLSSLCIIALTIHAAIAVFH
jgi:hypothetical protein